MTLHIQQTDSKICLQILDIWARMKSTIEQFADEHDLTLQQIFVLYHLSDEDHILMGTLAKNLHCDASNVTGIVDRLQSSDLITRHELPNDRRAKQLAITGKGRALIDDLVPRLPASIGMQCLNGSELDDLYRLLGKLPAS
jgi:DNA-binding MarR family transcriptional regulator